VQICDLRNNDQVRRQFERTAIRTVVHLAAVLPTAFHADPIGAAEVNVTGSLNVLRAAMACGATRFVFGSSMSVYGSAPTTRGLTERDPAAPDEPYGAAKRTVELVGEGVAAAGGLGFMSLRIARVVGPGATNTASAWRSQIFETSASTDRTPLSIPFAPTARLSLTHVDEVARMVLSEAPELRSTVYNSPAEEWETQHLARLVEAVGKVPVLMGDAHGGPLCDGSLFCRDFGFELTGLAAHLEARGQGV
jgi:UDP-glucose 4-epimerase